MPRRKRTYAFWTCGILLGLVLLAVAVDLVTGSPRLCASCHEMSARAQSWGRSGHSEVACVSCHQPPLPWHALPRRLVDRGRLLGRDVVSHMSGFEGQVDGRSSSGPVKDGVCLQCHDPDRKATSGFRILIEHAEHAKRNGSCVSCHVNTSHPPDTRSNPLSLMAQCFTCHGTTRTAKAPGECDLCHPSGFELFPSSHANRKWRRGHGKVAQSDARQCVMCHARRFCDDCHGLEMPHPWGWAEEAKTGHAPIATRDRQVCSRCHRGGPDLCTMCHHEAYDRKQHPWIERHPVEVRTRGTAHCMECHEPLFCTRCHVGGS